MQNKLIEKLITLFIGLNKVSTYFQKNKYISYELLHYKPKVFNVVPA